MQAVNHEIQILVVHFLSILHAENIIAEIVADTACFVVVIGRCFLVVVVGEYHIEHTPHGTAIVVGYGKITCEHQYRTVLIADFKGFVTLGVDGGVTGNHRIEEVEINVAVCIVDQQQVGIARYPVKQVLVFGNPLVASLQGYNTRHLQFFEGFDEEGFA